MVIRRGEIYWASLTQPTGSGPGYRRPVVVVQDNRFNDSRISTVVVAAVTSNLRLAEAPGNVYLPRDDSGLPQDSVVNVSQLLTVDKSLLSERVRWLSPNLMRLVDDGLRLVIGL